tara:strand:- start:464 stop:1837 length:1374 start_codon:yes stop_codon:yes gene_type:complete
MAAIITDPLKKQLVQTVFDEVTNNTKRYYIGIGRSEQWDSSETVPTPTDTPRTIRNLRAGLQSIRTGADVTYVVPRYNWSSGAIYNAYDDDFASIPTNTYYVLTEDNQVYICLQQSKSATGAAQPSTVKPTGTTTKPFKTADGYIWKFLYALSAARASAFLSANFVPTEKILDSAGGAGLSSIQIQQASVQDSAVPGQVLGVSLTAGGTGFTSTPTITINGDGIRAAATATISSGSIVKIEMDSSTDSGMTMGQGYNFASVVISGGGGSGASARAILGPKDGIGADNRDELKSTSLMFNTKPVGAEDSNFIVGQDFRQVALIRDPKKHTDSDFTATTGRVLSFLKVTSTSDAASFSVDTTITGGTTDAKAIIDEIDSDRLFFHQSEATGFKPFQEGEAISGGGNTATLVAAGVDADSDAFTTDDVNRTTGDILYIENRAPVVRAANQTEDIKIVITL